MTHTWEQLEGVSLAGTYGLDQCLGSDHSGAFFLTTFGPEQQRAVLKMVVADPPTAGEQLRLWEQIAWLNHPGLMSLLASGRAEWSGESYLYAVFEAPDDSLTAAVQNGPLGEAETRDVLIATIDALRYLHHLGWAHTSIDTEHVVALGDHIKLASDTLKPRATPEAQSHDVWALGALLFELVSGHRIQYGESPDVFTISEPLRTVILHAAEPDESRRWTAAQLAEMAHTSAETPSAESAYSSSSNGRYAAEPPRPDIVSAVVPFDEAVVPPVKEPEPPVQLSHPLDDPQASPIGAVGKHPTLARETLPTSKPEPPARPPIMVHEPFTRLGNETPFPPAEPPSRPPFARYVPMVAVAAIALLVIIFVIAHHATPVPPAVAIAPPPSFAERSAPAAERPSPVAERPPVAKRPSPVAPPAKVSNVSKDSPQTWRVVSFTYSRMKDAEHKAASINAKYKDLHAEVFTLNSNPPAYLISLGAHLTREEAASLQRKAIGKGMPRDTFIRNFSN